MNPRTVEAAQGWRWIVDGYGLFRKNMPMWISYTMLLGAMWFGSMLIPILGPLLFNLFSVVLFASLLLACHAQERNEPLTPRHLFAGFKANVPALITVGGVYLAGTIIIIGIVYQSVDPSVFAMVKQGKKPPDPETAMQIMRAMGGALMIAMMLYMPLMMAVWFAPALIVFEKLPPGQAMKLSFAACLSNILPCTVYGVALMVLWIIASIPFLLGLIVLLPVIFCSVYVSYKDIFGLPPVTPNAAQP